MLFLKSSRLSWLAVTGVKKRALHFAKERTFLSSDTSENEVSISTTLRPSFAAASSIICFKKDYGVRIPVVS